MKKTVFTLSLLAALLCSCTSALDPTEEPIIRGKGIEDRIYLTSIDRPDKEVACTVNIEGSLLTLQLNETANLTVSLYNSETHDFVFTQLLPNAKNCQIDLTSYPDGNYTLYLNEKTVYLFTLKKGAATPQKDGSSEVKSWKELTGSQFEYKVDTYGLTNYPKDGGGSLCLSGAPAGLTTFYLKGTRGILIDKDYNLCPTSDANFEAEIIRIPNVKGVEGITEVPAEGWSDKAPLESGDGYIVRCRDWNERSQAFSDYTYTRIYVFWYYKTETLEPHFVTGHILYQSPWNP